MVDVNDVLLRDLCAHANLGSLFHLLLNLKQHLGDELYNISTCLRYIEKTQNRFLHAKGQLGLRQPARAGGPTHEARAKGLQWIRLILFVSGLIANV